MKDFCKVCTEFWVWRNLAVGVKHGTVAHPCGDTLSSAKLGFWEWAFLLCATVCPTGQHQLDTVVFTIWFACLVSGRKLGCSSAGQEDSQQLSTNCATATPLPRGPSSTTTKNTSEPHSCFLQLCTNFTTATPLPRGPSSTTTKNTSKPHSCFLQLCTNFTTATPLPRGPSSTTTKNTSKPHSCFLQLCTNFTTATPLPRGPSSTTKNTSEPHSCFLQLCTNFTTATPLPRGPSSTTKNTSEPRSCFLQLCTNCAAATPLPRFCYNKEHFWTTLLLSVVSLTLVVVHLCCARVNSLFLLLSVVVTCMASTNKSEPLDSHILCRHVCACFDCRYVHATACRHVCRCFKCQPATTVKRLWKSTQETVW